MKILDTRYKSACLVLVLSFLILLALTPVLQAGSNPIIDESYPRARLIVGGKPLSKKILLTKARVAPFGKIMRGRASIQNLTDKAMTLEYKFDWYDDEGFIIGDGGIWDRIKLRAREIRPLKSLGKSKHASKMQLIVRYPGDIFIDASQAD